MSSLDEIGWSGPVFFCSSLRSLDPFPIEDFDGLQVLVSNLNYTLVTLSKFVPSLYQTTNVIFLGTQETTLLVQWRVVLVEIEGDRKSKPGLVTVGNI